MKILIIEDNDIKINYICQQLSDITEAEEILVKRSYQTGLEAVMTIPVNLVLLDMSLPTFEIGVGEDGFHFDAFAGREILAEMKRKGRMTSVVLITQFVTFGEGDEQTTLEELDAQLRAEYSPFYLGSIYYGAGETHWREQLSTHLTRRRTRPEATEGE